MRQVVASAEQRRLLDPALHAIAVPHHFRAYRVLGDLDVASLRAAWLTVVRRHEALRTTFARVGDVPVQCVGEPDDSTFTITDLSREPLADTPAFRSRWCAAVQAQPVDPRARPPVRLHVARLDAVANLVMLVAHPAVADERSMALVVRDLSDCYDAIVAGGATAPAPAAQYADYVRWQYEQPPIGEEPPGTTALAVAADRLRGALPPGQGLAEHFDWTTELGEDAGKLAADEGTAPAAVLCAAFVTALQRYTAAPRLAVAVTLPLRPDSRFDDVVGPVDDRRVLRVDFSATPAFRHVLRQVAGQLAERPYPRVGPPRTNGATPAADGIGTAITLVAPDEAVLRLHATVVRAQPVADVTAPADLALRIATVGGRLAGSLCARRAVFEPATVTQVLRHLGNVVRAAVRTPDLPADDLRLDDAEQVLDLVRDGNRIAAGTQVRRPVHELVRHCAQERPAAPAVVSAGTTLTYDGLLRHAALVRAALLRAGVTVGAAVAVRMSTGPLQAPALLGVYGAGAFAICLGTGDPGERGRTALTELRPRALLVTGDPAQDRFAAWYSDAIGGAVIDVAAPDPAGDVRYLAAPPRLDARAYVAYTSGSTGAPKGIAQSHASLAQFVGWLAGTFAIGPGARVAQWAAPGYDASLCELFAALTAGAALYPVPERIRAHPGRMVDWLAANDITFFQTVPSFAREMHKVLSGRGGGPALPALDHLLLAGERLPGDLVNALRAALPHARLVNLYGPTESILATWYAIDRPLSGTAPIGEAIPGRQVVVVDRMDRPCPVGVPGELLIRSPYVSPGYVGGAASRLESFRAPSNPAAFGPGDGRWFRTGDLGRRRWDGALEFLGRRDEQVKFYGVRLELTDVEAALHDHDSVAQCAVVPVTDDAGFVTGLVAHVVPVDPADPAAAPGAWRRHLRRRFGAAMPPVVFRTVPGLPRNAGGKVDRRLLQARER